MMGTGRGWGGGTWGDGAEGTGGGGLEAGGFVLSFCIVDGEAVRVSSQKVFFLLELFFFHFPFM